MPSAKSCKVQKSDFGGIDHRPRSRKQQTTIAIAKRVSSTRRPPPQLIFDGPSHHNITTISKDSSSSRRHCSVQVSVDPTASLFERTITDHTAKMASTDPPISQQEIISRYRQLTGEMQSLIQQLTKAEMERNEHSLVEETLAPLDPDRRAFRLVGGVLVSISFDLLAFYWCVLRVGN